MNRIKSAVACLLLLLLAVPCAGAEGKAVANVTASTTNGSVVAGVSGKKIRVTGLALVVGSTATSVTFRSKPAGTGTDISPAFLMGANGVLVLPANREGWFETVAGESLTVTTGSGSTTGILVTYRLE